LAYLGGSKVLLFGGWGRGGYRTDTWVYDTEADVWHEIMIDGPSPPIRGDFPMSYLEDGRVMLFGGSYPDNGLKHRNDTWLFDAEEEKWLPVEPKGDIPAPRCDGALAFLGAGKALLFGGWQDRKDRIFNDTWEFDLKIRTWKMVALKAPKPARRHIHAMSRAGDGLVVLFGGSSETNETWEYLAATQTWKQTSRD